MDQILIATAIHIDAIDKSLVNMVVASILTCGLFFIFFRKTPKQFIIYIIGLMITAGGLGLLVNKFPQLIQSQNPQQYSHHLDNRAIVKINKATPIKIDEFTALIKVEKITDGIHYVYEVTSPKIDSTMGVALENEFRKTLPSICKDSQITELLESYNVITYTYLTIDKKMITSYKFSNKDCS